MSEINKYTVTGPNGEVLTVLNGSLAQRQGVSDEAMAALVTSHQLRHVLFTAAEQVKSEPLKLRMLARMFTALEFEQQRLWNFALDDRFHHFFELPGCTCPKLDNLERLGTSYSIRALDCPIHGEPKQ
jgi:hypothetical protein